MRTEPHTDMIKTITNHDIAPLMWERLYTRDELRRLAKNFSIERGKDKYNTSINLATGKRHDGTIATFQIQIVTP